MEFYNQLNRDYDLMTRDRTRWKGIAESYRPIIEEFEVRRVIDAGCGSGGESIHLAQMGLEVIGVDLSSQLINIARRKARRLGIKVSPSQQPDEPGVKFEVGDIRKLENIPDGWADLIICRGNTLPHLLTEKDLIEALRCFRRCSRRNAILILGWLNYRPILKTQTRIIGITGSANRVFIRFYDFFPEGLLNFNILRLKRTSKWEGQLLTTQLKPWTVDDVGMLAVQSQWGDLEIYADLMKRPFDPDESRDVVLIARAV